MNNAMESNLHRAAVLTFEELGLVFSSDECNEEQQNAPVEAMVEVSFQGPHCGRLMVTVCGGLLPGIVLNMLGDDEEPSQEQLEDALKEIANVICGNMLPSLDGPGAEYRIESPQVIDGLPDKHGAETSLVAKTQVGLDEGRAEIALFLIGDGDGDGVVTAGD